MDIFEKFLLHMGTIEPTTGLGFRLCLKCSVVCYNHVDHMSEDILKLILWFSETWSDILLLFQERGRKSSK